MITSRFKIDGMTCQSCVAKVTTALKNLPSVDSVVVSLNDKSATLNSALPVELPAVRDVLAHFSKYSVLNFSESALPSDFKKTDESAAVSKLVTYKPLIVLFSYVFFVSMSYQIFQKQFEIHIFMNHIMAGFFIGLSFFKMLSLNAFAESFSGYDPLAKKWLSYGLLYPFIELALGLLFITATNLLFANLITIFILTLTTYGVVKKLQTKSKLLCACAGAGFSLPLSGVTVFENAVMILMALYNLQVLLY